MRWPHYEHVFFDCDSTLTTVEGIDIMAESAGKGWRVEVLTQAAMDGELDLEEVYGKRLRAVKPTHRQIRDIRRAYKQHTVEDAKETIAALQELGHTVYIISGGLLEPVREFGIFLGVAAKNIRAVGVTYNELSGDWWEGGDEQYMTYDDGALTVSDGKAQIVRELLHGQRGRSLLVGDGYSDLLAGGAVDLFAGFGGVVQRRRVSEEAPVFLNSGSIAPILAIAAGPAAVLRLRDTAHADLARKTLDLIKLDALQFNDQRIKERFKSAVEAAFQAENSWIGRNAMGDRGHPGALDEFFSS